MLQLRTPKIGVLLLNLGTPSAPSRFAVWHYLNQFLSDPRVIRLPFYIRWPLVYGLIAPFRSSKTAKAYRSIWGNLGSPLLTQSKMQKDRLQEILGNDTPVTLGMRYGNPSIHTAIQILLEQKIERLKIIPLFPQYASATTGSVLEKTLCLLKKQMIIPSIEVMPSFYDHPQFIQALAQTAVEASETFQADFLLMSFHGLPENHIAAVEAKNFHCDHTTACPSIQADNAACYRAQCYATARALAKVLRLNADEYQVTFQSRLGKTPWIKPYTDQILPTLKANGVKRLAVICPAFVADCLETLEEVGIRLKEAWLQLGGEAFLLIPCVNSHPAFIRFLSEWVKSAE